MYKVQFHKNIGGQGGANNGGDDQSHTEARWMPFKELVRNEDMIDAIHKYEYDVLNQDEYSSSSCERYRTIIRLKCSKRFAMNFLRVWKRDSECAKNSVSKERCDAKEKQIKSLFVIQIKKSVFFLLLFPETLVPCPWQSP